MSTAVDPFANMPAISPDLGNAMWKGVGEGLDFFINKVIIEEGGKLLGAGVMAVAGKTVDVAAGAASMTASVGAAPFKDIMPSASPMGDSGPKVEAPSRGKERLVEAAPSLEANLGNFSPSIVGMGQSQGGYSRSV